ncbi:hypothetical protein [Psychromonas ingrahamii]|uniref:hypothetical protein n=1 Tax=Psychromonas ingrahamii TaxID=357794 RepID=UPI0005A1A511|nr:hypothetical protein [Psychromonas ingrahamii]
MSDAVMSSSESSNVFSNNTTDNTAERSPESSVEKATISNVSDSPRGAEQTLTDGSGSVDLKSLVDQSNTAMTDTFSTHSPH